MKFSIFLSGLMLLKLNTHIHCACVFSLGSYDKTFSDSRHRYQELYSLNENRLTCRDFNGSFLSYSNEYENPAYVRLSGNFTEIAFDSRYTKLSRVKLYSESLVNFNMNNLNNLTSLVDVRVSSLNYKTVDLNFNAESNKFGNLQILEFTGAQNIIGSFAAFVNLKYISLYEFKNETFDFNSLPNSLVRFSL